MTIQDLKKGVPVTEKGGKGPIMTVLRRESSLIVCQWKEGAEEAAPFGRRREKIVPFDSLVLITDPVPEPPK